MIRKILLDAKEATRRAIEVPFTRRFRARTSIRRAGALEDGDTLVELLVAITVLGLVGVALMGGFVSSIGASAEYRSFASIDTVLKNFAEAATYNIEMQPSPLFIDCAAQTTSQATSSTYYDYNNSAATPILYNAPAGYTVTATIQYVSGSSISSTCTPLQYEPQLITATATGPKNVSATLSFVVATHQYEPI